MTLTELDASLRLFNRELRQGLVPASAPHLTGCEVAAGTMLEDEGSDDSIWDAFTLADGRKVLALLHATPGRFPPAHHLALARALLRQAAAVSDSLAEVLALTNTAVAETRPPHADQVVHCGLLAENRQGIVWAAAGQVPGGLLRRAGTLDEFEVHGPPLGVLAGFRYGSQDYDFSSGDTALVLSHGSTGLFRGAADLVASLHAKPVREVVSTLHKALRRAGEEGGDELSVLVVRNN